VTLVQGRAMNRDPEQLRRELAQLIKKQIDIRKKETFGGLTDAQHHEYLQRQTRINELYRELQRLTAAA
jgi:hypothetical protein